MSCPRCEELGREHSLWCEEEAKASLVLRYRMMGVTTEPAELHIGKHCETIHTSRRKQAELALELERHRAMVHSA